MKNSASGPGLIRFTKKLRERVQRLAYYTSELNRGKALSTRIRIFMKPYIFGRPFVKTKPVNPLIHPRPIRVKKCGFKYGISTSAVSNMDD